MTAANDLAELSERLSQIERMDAEGAPIEKLTLEIADAHHGFTISALRYEVGSDVFRARRVTKKPRHIDDLGYPSPELTPIGRLNEPRNPMFYGSFGASGACLFECGAKKSEVFVISHWTVEEPILCNHFGYVSGAKEVLKEKREFAASLATIPTNSRDEVLSAWQSKIFTRPVEKGSEHLYRLSIALARFGLDELGTPGTAPLFGGIVYPSVALNLFGDNIAFRPQIADSCLALQEARLVGIVAILPPEEVRREGMVANCEVLDSAFSCGEDGTLQWQSEYGPFRQIEVEY